MSFVGNNSVPLAHRPLVDDVCPVCQRENSRYLFLVQDYVDIFFMPFTPAGKSGEIRCQNCPAIIENFGLSDDQQFELQEMKTGAGTPVWTFAGMLGLPLLIMLISLPVLNAASNTAPRKKGPSVLSMIMYPKQGDMYEIEMEEDDFADYSWVRIDSLSADSVWLGVNNQSTPIKEGLSAIRGGCYDSLSMTIHRRDLKTMLDKKEVLDIHRD
jgi:hypothetical protein